MPRPLLLIVDGESLRAPGLVSALENEGWAVRWVPAVEGEAFLRTGLIPDLLLLGGGAEGVAAPELVRQLREHRPGMPVVVLTDNGSGGTGSALDVQDTLERSQPAGEIIAALRRFRPEPRKLTTDDIFGDLLADLDAPPQPPPDPFVLFGEGRHQAAALGLPTPRQEQAPLSAQDIFGQVVEEVEALPVSVPERGRLPVGAVSMPTPREPAHAAPTPVEPLGPSDFTLSGISGVHDPFEWSAGPVDEAPVGAAVVVPAPVTSAAAPAAARPEVLEEYGNYFLLEKIAIGGMAELFKAQQRGVQGFQKIVAIKRILPHFSDNEDFVTMFIDEAKLAAQLTHPNIVQIFDLGKAGSSYYIAMEYVNGRDLRTLLRKVREYGSPFPEQVAAFVVMKVAAALDYAHRKRGFDDRELKLVHRDISPQNLLLSTEGAVKLVDFGIAKAASKASHTVAGALKGKLLYMSPEQALGQPLDNRSDLYSLGLVLFELLTGERCFQADSELGVLEKVRLGRISDLQATNRNISREMVAIVNRALQKSVDHRYPSARFMERDLREYLQRHGASIAEHDVAEYAQALLNGQRELLDTLVAARFPQPGSLTSGAYRVTGDHTSATATAHRFGTTQTGAGLEPALPPPPSGQVARPRWLLPVILGLAVLLVVMLLVARWS